jgi:hypothetical protein
MAAMHPPPSVVRRPPALAIVLSLILHLLVLLIPLKEPTPPARPAKRLQATLAPRMPMPTPPVAVAPQKPVQPHVEKPKRRILALQQPRAALPSFTTPKWTEVEKTEMNEFLAETARAAKVRPTLAQRSLAMARNLGQRQAQMDEGEGEILERIPDSPPVDPFSLELYMDALVKKLNRSSAFVRDQRTKQGQRTASVQVRLNPDGTLESLKVLNAADQQDEIEFIKSVVRQATPFSPFPSDLRRSARTLSLRICIQPAREGGSVGFSRSSGAGC